MEEPRAGQLALPDQVFCPYSAVAKYPFRYFHGIDDERKHIASKFWDGGRLKQQGWSIYYIRSLLDDNRKPLLLIPKTEVDSFFQKVKIETEIHLPVPDHSKNPGFSVAFGGEGEPRPQYLGRTTGETGVTDLEVLIPKGEMTSHVDRESLAKFHQRLELAYLAGKNDTQAQRDKKKKNRLTQKGRWCAQLRRTQCYLGVRPRNGAKDSNSNPVLPLLEVKKPAPYRFNLNVIFICIDIEAYERDSKKLTEVGVSTLDTLDLIKCVPGESGLNWADLIRSRHFRVADYAHLVNRQFIQGCPDDFNFGASEWISVNEISKVVDGCFHGPYSSPGYYTPHPTRRRDCPRYGSNIEPLATSDKSQQRNVILVGHEIRSDIAYLKSIGYDLGKLGNIVEYIDTIDLWRAWQHESQGVKLSRVLYELEADAHHLHNAGNDAGYTLQALLGIALSALNPSKKDPTSVPVDPSDDAAQEKLERSLEEEAEWADVEKEAAADGGHGQSISDLEFDLSMNKGSRARDKPSKETSGPSGQQSKPAYAPGPSSCNKSGPAQQRSAQNKGGKPKAKPGSLPQQMEKRLVIFDDEDYNER